MTLTQCPRTARRGMILLVVLVIISVLALISVSFSYRMDAERVGVQALQDIQQARFAAESGLSRVLLLLRDERGNVERYYNNPDSFRRVPVWLPDSQGGMGGTETEVYKQVVPNQPCWRYSVVSYERQSEEKVLIRYGLTDEASKININYASRGELLRLVKTVEPFLKETPPEALVDCLLDWRTTGDEPISPAGAKTSWYMPKLGYGCKGRPFDSVEELLMVKNWNATLLFGEDANRNGYLDENEDDGEDGAYPPDNGDGELSRGLLPFVTVYSWDFDSGNDNKLRVDINNFPWEQLEGGELPRMYEYLRQELTSETIQFLVEAKKRGYKFKSIGELWGLEVFEDGSSNMDGLWKEYETQVKEENAVPMAEGEEVAEEEGQPGKDIEGGGQGDGKEGDGKEGDGKEGDGKEGGDKSGDDKEGDGKEEDGKEGDDKEGGAKDGGDKDVDEEPDDGTLEEGTPKKDKNKGRRRTLKGASVKLDGSWSTPLLPQVSSIVLRVNTAMLASVLAAPKGSANSDNETKNNRNGSSGGRRPQDNRRPSVQHGGRSDGSTGDPATTGENGVDSGLGGDNNKESAGIEAAGNEAADGDKGKGRDEPGKTADNNAGDGQGGKEATSRPETEEEKQKRQGVGIQFPQNAEQMHVMMDRLTVSELGKTRGRLPGLINANTAPVEVLRTIIGLTDEDAVAIAARRKGMSATELRTPAWMVTTGAVAPAKFAVISNKLTTRPQQFTADVIGFADHVGTYKRLQVMIEMQGHIAQVRYYRDISALGIGYPVKDDERSEGLAYQPQ